MKNKLTPTDLIAISTYITTQCRVWFDTENRLRDVIQEDNINPAWVMFCQSPLYSHENTFLINFSYSTSSMRLRVLYDKLLFFTPEGFFEEQAFKYLKHCPKNVKKSLKLILKTNPEYILHPLVADIYGTELANGR